MTTPLSLDSEALAREMIAHEIAKREIHCGYVAALEAEGGTVYRCVCGHAIYAPDKATHHRGHEADVEGPLANWLRLHEKCGGFA